MRKPLKAVVLLLMFLAAVFLFGCEGDKGPAGKSGTSTGTLSGTVTFEDFQGTPVNLSGVTVSTNPDQGGATTAADGTYSASLPVGNYTVTYSATNFESQTETVSIVAGGTETVDVTLTPTTPVVVQAQASDTSPLPGDTVDISVTVTPVDGSVDTGTVQWTVGSVSGVTIADDTAASTTVTLPGVEAYKTELFEVMTDPTEFEPGYEAILNRTIVQGVDPLSLEEAAAVTLTATVTTTSGDYEGSMELATDLSGTVQVNPGVNNVARGVPVLLHGTSDFAGFSWTLTPPAGSTAALDDPTSQNPSFTPDVAGQYTATLTNSTGVALTNTVDVFAGTWVGIITGQDVGGERTTDPSCMACHGSVAEATDNFTPWKKSGHSEIFTDNINTSGHYSTSCFPCHTVGYNLTAVNDGIDDQADYQAFLDQFTTNGTTFHADPDNWTNIVTDFPDVARRANIQCENCHGPQNSTAGHASLIGTGNSVLPSRTSLSAEVCGSCHGEPPRHGRYQQWKESGHGNVELAIDEGTRASCAPCHSANGFVQWSKNGFDAAFTPTVTWNDATVQPQTCTACHPTHDPGDTSGKPNTAKVRVEDNTPVTRGGFMATGVGRGATCMMCHNNRRGGYNTSMEGMTFGGNIEMNDETPHHGPQGDVLMGENAFFVTVGARSPHSFITDTCTNCHMELTQPPAEFSFEGGGTNHTFEPSLEICSNCHGAFDGGTLQASVAALQDDLEAAIGAALATDIDTIATDASVTGVLLDYDFDSDTATVTYGAIIDTSGAPANTISSIAEGSRGRFNITLGDATVLSNVSYSDIVIWKDSIAEGGDGDGVVDLNEVYTGDTNGEGIVDSCIGVAGQRDNGPVAPAYSTPPGAATCEADGGVVTNGQTIAEANWNWVLVDQDASGGIHNPNFVVGLENASIAALQ
jgi:hypothetical protein